MSMTLLISSGFLFLGGLMMQLIHTLSYSGWMNLLSWILILAGGLPLVCLWGREIASWLNVPADEGTAPEGEREGPEKRG